MKVKMKSTIPFKDLNMGDVFQYGNSLYMVIVVSEHLFYPTASNCTIKKCGVCLQRGIILSIEQDKMVTPVDGIFVEGATNEG